VVSRYYYSQVSTVAKVSLQEAAAAVAFFYSIRPYQCLIPACSNSDAEAEVEVEVTQRFPLAEEMVVQRVLQSMSRCAV